MGVFLPGSDHRFAGLYLQVLGLSICTHTETATTFEGLRRTGCSVLTRLLPQLQIAANPFWGSGVRLSIRLGDLLRDTVGPHAASLLTVVCPPALPATLNDGVNVPRPVIQDARINVGSVGPDQRAQIVIHPDLSKQFRKD